MGWQKRSSFSWDVTQRGLVVGYRRFEATYLSHLQGSPGPSKMEPISCFETSVYNYQFALPNIKEERNLIYTVAASWYHAGWQSNDNPNLIFRDPLKQDVTFLRFITNYFIIWNFTTDICNFTLEMYSARNVVCLKGIQTVCAAHHSDSASAGCHPDSASAVVIQTQPLHVHIQTQPV